MYGIIACDYLKVTARSTGGDYSDVSAGPIPLLPIPNILHQKQGPHDCQMTLPWSSFWGVGATKLFLVLISPSTDRIITSLCN